MKLNAKEACLDMARRGVVDAVRQLKCCDQRAENIERDRRHWQSKMDHCLAEIDRLNKDGTPYPDGHSESSFQMLKVRNQWESISYYFDGTDPVKDRIPIGSDKGGTVTVQWPDGTIEANTPVVVKTETHTYGDMGHTYEATSKILYVEILQYGTKVIVPMDGLRIADLQWHP